MGCTICGTNVRCNCSSGLLAGSVCTSCQNPNCVGCGTGLNTYCNQGAGCGTNIVPSSPAPYYACAPSCQESNTKKVVINQFAQALKVANSWNVPACGLTATLSIPGLTSIVIGSYLWNEEYGYFEVTAFDSGLQQVTVINNCNDGNATPGTNVPACTEFINAAPPAADFPESTPCVEIDFTAPAVSACIDITLTNTTGILPGDIVQIGSGFYRVDELKPNNIINICNDGDGITPGTAVIAKDASGNYQYCLQIISTSPCDREVVTNGAVVVCNSDGQTTTIEMPEDGWVFEGTSASGTNFVGAIPIGLEPFCTRLAAPLSIIAGTAGYTITVNDSTGYILGDIIQIAGYPNVTGGPDMRFTISGLPGPTQIVGSFTTLPAVTATMPVGTNVCRIGCCELIQNELDTLTCGGSVFRIPIGSATYSVPVTLNANGYFEAVIDASILSVDLSGAACPDSNYAVRAHVSIATLADFNIIPTPDDSVSSLGLLYHEIELAWSVGGTPSNRTAGKIVYTDILTDSRAGYGPPEFPAVPEATFTHLPSPAPGYPLTYHQNDVAALAILTPPLGSTDLGISYRTLIGTTMEVSSLIAYDSIEVLISGWVDVYTVNG